MHLPLVQVPLQHCPLPLHVAPAGRLHWPALPPVAQQTSGLVQVTDTVPAQTPLVQTSLLVHALLSLQVVLFGLFPIPQTPPTQVACWHWSVGCGHVLALVQVIQPGIATQVPVAGSQVVHGGQVFGLPAWQVPLLHVSLSVQRFPSSHGVLSRAFWVTQSPVAGAQTLTLHGSVLAGQVFCGPPWHWPLWHVSSVHRSLSRLHGVPSSLNWFSGHWAEVPVQNSVTSHSFAATRQITALDLKPLSGHRALLPVQVAARSHSPAASRQTVPSGTNSFSGH